MAYRLYKLGDSPNWYVDFGRHRGRRIRSCAGTDDKKQAEAYAKHRQAELWRQEKLGERVTATWDLAVIEWLKEHSENRSVASIEGDKQRLRLLSDHFRGIDVDDVTPGDIKTATMKFPGIAAGTRNRYITTGIAILNFAYAKNWRTRAASRDDFSEPKHRIRYLTGEEAGRLLANLPNYLRAMAEFTLATGLRETNVRLLEWSNVDMPRSIAWVHGDKRKPEKASRCRSTRAP